MTNDAPARTGRIRSATIDRRCPDLSISSGLAAYRYRAGRGWQQGAIARSERSKHPRYFIFLGTLLEQMTPTPLVKTALQRLVSVEPEEERISTRLSTRDSWRHSCAVPTRGLSTTCRGHARKPEFDFALIRGSSWAADSPLVGLSLARMDCRKPASNCSSFRCYSETKSN